MLKSELLRALQQEIRRHDFNQFVHEPSSIAPGGSGALSLTLSLSMPTQGMVLCDQRICTSFERVPRPSVVRLRCHQPTRD